MARVDQVVAALASGAGRTLDLQWPGIVPTQTASAQTTVTTRIAPSFNVVGNPNQWQQGGMGSQIYVQYQDATCVRFRSGLLNGGRYFMNAAIWGIRPRLGFSSIPLGYDPFAAYRLLTVMAFGNIPSQDVDYGIQITAPGVSPAPAAFIFQGNAAGIGIVRRATGDVALVVRPASTTFFPTYYDITPSVPGGFDPTLFHAYEMRIVSATQTVQPTIDILVDGIPTRRLGWQTNLLPFLDPVYPQFRVSMNNSADLNADLFVVQTNLQASQNILGCL